ncbi:LPS export ABC transporter permease LptF [Phenylobacterium immobile]|uniref:LPS export ABC transporter permease LptF n=1 Tax=Phenylobacterium immobile TaxID=21 RepID=UPI000A9FDF72|nr:LPS export ABC transporter permease LptF [Phenylobacterium immobile]
MRLIDRYLLRQLLGPTLLATAALTGVALLSQSLSALDLMVNQRQSALVFLKVTLLAMPQLINIVLPIALFVAALVALNRLHTEQEIVVAFAGGMSRWRVISPGLRLGATVALLALLMNLFVQPACLRAMRAELFEIRTDLAATLVRPGAFVEPTPGLTVYAQSVDGAGEFLNLFIHQERDGGTATTYTAESGHMATRQGRPVMVMLKGSNQEFSERGVLNYLTFDEYIFDLTSLSRTDERVHYKPSDRYPHELFFPDLQQDWEKRNRLGLLAEGHARIATPLYNIAFMALALGAIIGAGFSRTGYGRRIAVFGAIAAVVRILGFVVQAGAEDAAWMNILQYLVPLAATVFALRTIFRQQVNRTIDISRKPSRTAAAASGNPA